MSETYSPMNRLLRRIHEIAQELERHADFADEFAQNQCPIEEDKSMHIAFRTAAKRDRAMERRLAMILREFGWEGEA